MNDTWIIPCNTSFFDINDHFSRKSVVVWRNYFTIKKGDTVYIYIGGTTRQIKYRCVVLENDVAGEVLLEHQYAVLSKKINNYFSKKEKYMLLHLVYTYPSKVLMFEQLKAHGLGQVQLQARPDRSVVRYIDQVNKELSGFERMNETNG